MGYYDEEGPVEESSEEQLESDEIDSSEEAFMRGYEGDKDAPECDECGSAIHEKAVRKEFDGELHKFCSDACVEEFEENL